MDFSGLTTDYTDYLKTAGSVSASKTEDAANAINKDSTDEEMMAACKQFEAYLLEQVFKEMEKTISFDDEEERSVPGLGSGGNALTEYYKEQTIAELAGQATDQGGVGLAQMLYEAMKRGQ